MANKNNNEFITKRDELISRYSITKLHAECYLCNYGDKYICYKYKGGCKSREQCKSIHEKELSNM